MFLFKNPFPCVLQSEFAECGHACLASIARFYGRETSLADTRKLLDVGVRGSTFVDLMTLAGRLGLDTRALKTDLDALQTLNKPAILHWGFRHFVVLISVDSKGATLMDPAVGIRTVSSAELSAEYTGVALEVQPAVEFQRKRRQPILTLRTFLAFPGVLSGLTRILLLGIFIQTVALISPLFVQWGVDEVLSRSDVDLLLVLGLALGTTALLQGTTTLLRAYFVNVMNAQLSTKLASALFARLLRLPMGFFERRHLGDITSRFSSIDSFQRTLSAGLLEAIIDGAIAIAILVGLFIYSPALAMVQFFLIVLLGITKLAFYTPVQRNLAAAVSRKANEQTHLVESIRGIQSIKLLGLADSRKRGLESRLSESAQSMARTQFLVTASSIANITIVGIGAAVSFMIAARETATGSLSLGMLFAALAYASISGQRSVSFFDKFFEMRSLRVHADRIDEILEEAVWDVGPVTKMQRTAELRDVPVLEVNDLAYKHSESHDFLFSGVSFRLAPGEAIAIVGKSGVGKTTLLKCILGLVPATSGEVRIGGQHIFDLSEDRKAQLMSSVMQEDFLFCGSVSENVASFRNPINAPLVEESLKISGLWHDVEQMPMGIDTLLGEMGMSLSSGQKQRLLLARALYVNPKLLVLDEATSNLDHETQRIVTDSLRQRKFGVVYVTHRPESLTFIKRICLLTSSGLVEVSQQPRTHSHSQEALE